MEANTKQAIGGALFKNDNEDWLYTDKEWELVQESRLIASICDSCQHSSNKQNCAPEELVVEDRTVISCVHYLNVDKKKKKKYNKKVKPQNML